MPSTVRVPIDKLVQGGHLERRDDSLAVEEPLEIRVGGKSLSVTMRTPGNDYELAAGFLFSEGIVRHAGDIASITRLPDGNPNIVQVVLARDAAAKPLSVQRAFVMTSACGLCGKASLAALESNRCPALPPPSIVFDARVLHGLPAALRARQSVFEDTGGLHAAALFDATGRLESLHEDVGRHNAVDKLIGHALLHGRTPAANSMVLVSGRASYELVQKCLMGGVPLLAAVGAPSSLAVSTAAKSGMTLVGFLRDSRFNVYSEPGRLQ
ncbi:formate dehydrogenase accessory sulfurtransferase FdhD [Paludibaculum fermentans]|uniref:formate dehydrogenase accessory sulfurtransferase FdhD n=1 Tax=Paludibaculum fermentans TaxID=1473598 RepID=UPI003EBE6041